MLKAIPAHLYLAPSGGGTGTGDWKTDGQHYRRCHGVHLLLRAAVRGNKEKECGHLSFGCFIFYFIILIFYFLTLISNSNMPHTCVIPRFLNIRCQNPSAHLPPKRALINNNNKKNKRNVVFPHLLRYIRRMDFHQLLPVKFGLWCPNADKFWDKLFKRFILHDVKLPIKGKN